MKTGITTIAGILGLGLLKRLGSRAITEVKTKRLKSIDFGYSFYIYCDDGYLNNVETQLEDALKSMIGDTFLDDTIREEGHEFIIKEASVWCSPSPDGEDDCHDLNVYVNAISDLDAPKAGEYSEITTTIRDAVEEIIETTFNGDQNIDAVEHMRSSDQVRYDDDLLIPLIQQRKRSRPSSLSRLRKT